MNQVIIYIAEIKRMNIHSFESFVKDELTTQLVLFTYSVLKFDRAGQKIYVDAKEHLKV